MPAIEPNLMLINADVAARERASTIVAQFAGRLMIAEDCKSALQLLSRNLIDLIVCDYNVIAQGQQVDDTIARFHRLPGRHDVPVLFTSGLQRSDVSLKKHRWGVAYHVHRAVEPQVLLGLIQTSLSLKVRQESVGRESEQSTRQAQTPPVPNVAPKPFGLTLPEVIMPPHESSILN